MSRFEAETAIEAVAEGIWLTRLSAAWNIGDNANGGYMLSPVLRAMRAVAGQPDPLTVTTHFLRPGVGDADAEVRVELIRAGRSLSTLRGELRQNGKACLAVLAGFADVSAPQPGGVPDEFGLPPPELPPPDACVHRRDLDQGVHIPLLSRMDVYLRPEHAHQQDGAEALIEGWVQLQDGTAPDTITLPLCVDAFPPSPIRRLANIGWVPTLELTVQTRRRPAPGWLRGRFHADELVGGRMIESGTLWDASGTVVARSRQIGLIMAR